MSELNFCSCFVLNGSSDWKKSFPDDWDLSTIEIVGDEKILGHKKIDGSIFKIMQTHNGKIFAVTK